MSKICSDRGEHATFVHCLPQLSRRARPLGAVLRTEELTAEAFSELLGVFALGEAEDVHVSGVAVEGMASVAIKTQTARDAGRENRRPHY
jgi:hypothetical protein